MSVRIDASGDYLRRTANLPPATGWTMAAWWYHVSTLNAYAALLELDNATSSATMYCGLLLNPFNGLAIIQDVGVTYTETSFTITPPTNAWSFIALTRSGTTLTGYYMTQAGTWQSVNSNQTGSPTWALMSFGNNAFSEYSQSRFAYMRAWDAALTQDELRREAFSSKPVRMENLNGYWPGFPGATERLRDYGPNGRNLTAGGTLTDEAGPPLPRLFDFPLAMPWKLSAPSGPALEQSAYRFYNDDGGENASTPAAAEDTPATIAPDTNIRLRVQVSADNNPDAALFRLEYRPAGSEDAWQVVSNG